VSQLGVRMAQRIIILVGQATMLIYGDPELEDGRLIARAPNGADVQGALPVLLQEGWEIKSIHPFGQSPDSAVILLSKG
jgi:hypothetical protein